MVQFALARDEIIPADLLVFLHKGMADYRANKELDGNPRFHETISEISQMLSIPLSNSYNLLL